MTIHDNKSKLQLLEDVGFVKYFTGNSWSEYNRKFFDNLAKKYDATNALHSFGTKSIIDKKAIEKIPFPINASVLDLCTGSGDICIRIAKKHPDFKIIALDASEKMLEIAKQKAKGCNNIDFVKGDALSLPYEDNSFDVLIISFGLRNLENIQAGLKEMQRVVKPGGYVVNIDQGKPENPVFKALYQAYFYGIAPLIGKLIFHIGEFNSFKYLPESNKYFPSQQELVKIFEEVGFKDINNYNYLLGAISQQIARVE